MNAILDGRAKFGCSISDFYRKPEIAAMLARHGLLNVPTETARDAPPAVAHVEPYQGVARWIALCPDCRNGEYIWVGEPRFLCARCANKRIGHQWRPVALPANYRQIERMLLRREDPETRVWSPDEGVDQLAVENVMLNGGGG